MDTSSIERVAYTTSKRDNSGPRTPQEWAVTLFLALEECGNMVPYFSGFRTLDDWHKRENCSLKYPGLVHAIRTADFSEGLSPSMRCVGLCDAWSENGARFDELYLSQSGRFFSVAMTFVKATDDWRPAGAGVYWKDLASLAMLFKVLSGETALESLSKCVHRTVEERRPILDRLNGIREVLHGYTRRAGSKHTPMHPRYVKFLSEQ